MANMIKTENLNLWYGENQALKNINIEISEKRLLHLSDRQAAVNLPFENAESYE